jgi:hypothetical protein
LRGDSRRTNEADSRNEKTNQTATTKSSNYKEKNMKKHFLFRVFTVIIAAFVFGLAGCEDSKDYDDYYTSAYDLNDFDGWWSRPDDYASEGFSMVNIFKVDAEASTWTPYNQYGGAGSTFNCRADENGLTLEMDVLGDAMFIYNGTALLNDDGGVEFVRSEPIVVDANAFDGKWFKNGDIDGDYYLIEGLSYQKFMWFDKDEPRETGTWKFADVLHFYGDNDSIQEKQIEFEPDNDDPFGGDSFLPSEDGIVFADTSDGVYYLREAAIGTDIGNNAAAKYTLIGTEWRSEEFGGPWLRFSYYGTFTATTFDSEGNGETEEAGKWSIDETSVTMVWNDGNTEIVEYSPESITVDYYGTIFKTNNW